MAKNIAALRLSASKNNSRLLFNDDSESFSSGHKSLRLDRRRSGSLIKMRLYSKKDYSGN